MIKYLLLIVTLSSCIKTNTLENSNGSDLQEVKLAFDSSKFPWNKETTKEQKDQFLNSSELKLTVTKADTDAKCKDGTSGSEKLSSQSSTIKLSNVKLTVGCTYNFDLSLAETKKDQNVNPLTYFKTHESSRSQKIIAGGNIQNFKLCLTNSSSYFNKEQAFACVDSLPNGGADTDINIDVTMGGKQNQNVSESDAFSKFIEIASEVNDDVSQKNASEEFYQFTKDSKIEWFKGSGKVIKRDINRNDTYWLSIVAQNGKQIIIVADRPTGVWPMDPANPELALPVPVIDVDKKASIRGKQLRIIGFIKDANQVIARISISEIQEIK